MYIYRARVIKAFLSGAVHRLTGCRAAYHTDDVTDSSKSPSKNLYLLFVTQIVALYELKAVTDT